MSLGRAITHHHVGVEELDSAYEITALDKPSPLSKCYRINVVDSEPGHQSINTFNIQFQDDDPKILGHNGLTDEVLLAILIDRTEHSRPVGATKERLGDWETQCRMLGAAMFCMRHAILERQETSN